MAKKIDQFLAKKIIILILLGAFTAFLASSIGGKVEVSSQVSFESAILMALVSLMLFFITGILWLSTAIFIKNLEER
ncbi:MAG: hypothetical protein QXM38_00240 [Candidatus Aenigmatarchaeota archaeon]